MQKIFESVEHLDTHCYEQYHLSEDLLMEHAALGIAQYIKEHHATATSILIVCGSGNNGADGITLARLLYPSVEVQLFLPMGVKSEMAIKQKKRLDALGVKAVDDIEDADIVIDALFGSGLNRVLDENQCALIDQLNALEAVKLACDIPSGVLKDGTVSQSIFKADVTLTMGALKWSLFSDGSKDCVGDIEVIDLGVDRSLYEGNTHKYLLEQEDLKLPLRTNLNTHKGSFGHCAVISGEKEGASILASLACLEFGTGLVTVVSREKKELPALLMQENTLPHNTTAICAGMGMGNYYDTQSLESFLYDHEYPMVIDADLLSMPMIEKLLTKQVVITPHPKEFCALLKLLGLADITVETLQSHRMHYARVFSHAYPHVVLVLKGANVLIVYEDSYYVNPYGSPKLSKGGSGDVLAGMIASLLAQGYLPLDAAISASLAHVFATQSINKSSYAVSAMDIIEHIGKIELS